MNENVNFISSEKSLIIEIVEENEDFECGCISLRHDSIIVRKLYDILSSDGIVVLADQVIVNKQNDVLAITLMLESGKSLRWKRTLTEADLELLLTVVSNDQESFMGGRYE